MWLIAVILRCAARAVVLRGAPRAHLRVAGRSFMIHQRRIEIHFCLRGDLWPELLA
jgi:hypothetical protein